MFENRNDAGTNVLLRELDALLGQGVMEKFPENKALQLFDLRGGVPRGAENYSYMYFETQGRAEIVADSADVSVPRVSSTGTKFTQNIETIALSYQISAGDEDRLASSPQFVFDSVLIRRNASLQGLSQRHNELFWKGNALHNIVGILSNANVGNGAVANNGAGSSTLWANKAGEEIYKDITEAYFAIISATKGVDSDRPNLLVLSPARYSVLATTLLKAGTAETILEAIRKNMPELRVEMESALDGAFTGGAEGFLMGNNRPEVIRLVAPIVVEQRAPRVLTMGAEYSVRGKNGGAEILYPKGFVKRYGI